MEVGGLYYPTIPTAMKTPLNFENTLGPPWDGCHQSIYYLNPQCLIEAQLRWSESKSGFPEKVMFSKEWSSPLGKGEISFWAKRLHTRAQCPTVPQKCPKGHKDKSVLSRLHSRNSSVIPALSCHLSAWDGHLRGDVLLMFFLPSLRKKGHARV